MKLISSAKYSAEDSKRVCYVFALENAERVADAYETALQLRDRGEIAHYVCDCHTLNDMEAILAGDRLFIFQRFYRNA